MPKLSQNLFWSCIVVTKPSIFQLIDLDRTLFDTSAFAKAITDEVNKTHPGLGTELCEQFEAAYENEETFFLLRYLRQEQGDDWFEELIEKVVLAHSAEAFVLPGVHQRLEFADTVKDDGPAWGILTYGDEIDQLMKLRIMGLEGEPIYLADTPDKGRVLKTWQTENGTFQLPDSLGGERVDRLTFEDDKLRAFSDLPDGVVGVWVKDVPEEEAQKVAIPENVVHVSNLFESTDYLMTQLINK